MFYNAGGVFGFAITRNRTSRLRVLIARCEQLLAAIVELNAIVVATNANADSGPLVLLIWCFWPAGVHGRNMDLLHGHEIH